MRELQAVQLILPNVMNGMAQNVRWGAAIWKDSERMTDPLKRQLAPDSRPANFFEAGFMPSSLAWLFRLGVARLGWAGVPRGRCCCS